MRKELFRKRILLDSISKTLFFKIILLISFSAIYYAIYSLVVSNNDFLSSVVYAHSFHYFNMMVILIIFLNTIYNCLIISKNYNYIIRLSDRRKYVNEVIKVNFVMNLFWIFIFLISFLTVLCFKQMIFLKFYVIKDYNINIVVYVLFYIIRYYLFCLLLSTIVCLLIIKFKKKITYIFMGIYTFGFLFFNDISEVTNKFHILPWHYFRTIKYSSFSMEISYSVLYLIILEFVIIILYKLCVYNKKYKFKELYFLFNDLNYFIKKDKLLIILYFVYPIVFLSINRVLDGNFIFKTALGLNVGNKNIYIISLISYEINTFFWIYVFVKSFIKDYSNISNIYLRYNYKIYYFVKNVLNIFLLFIIKLSQYFLLFVMVKFVLKKSVDGVLLLFVKDYCFVLLIGALSIFLYILFKISKKNSICYFGAIIMIIIFIMNLVNISNINFISYFVLSGVTVFFTNRVIIEQNKKIIQEIGGI